jgi:hypothetical protein
MLPVNGEKILRIQNRFATRIAINAYDLPLHQVATEVLLQKYSQPQFPFEEHLCTKCRQEDLFRFRKYLLCRSARQTQLLL